MMNEESGSFSSHGLHVAPRDPERIPPPPSDGRRDSRETGAAAPTVSVIIPCYNGERYIREAVDSALDQTHSTVQVIVVNDGSTDRTAAILDEFGDRITIVNQPNRGLASARNAALPVARGEWLAFLDADDCWVAHKLERQLQLADDAVDLIYTDRVNVGDRGGLPELHSELFSLYEGDVFFDLLAIGNVITASSVLMRRAAFIKLGGFFLGAPGTEDWDLWVRVAAHGTIRVCREPLVFYRLHCSNMSRTDSRMRTSRIAVTRRALEHPRGRTLTRSQRRRIWCKTLMSNAADAFRSGNSLAALGINLLAAGYWPFAVRPYKESLRALLGLVGPGFLTQPVRKGLECSSASTR